MEVKLCFGGDVAFWGASGVVRDRDMYGNFFCVTFESGGVALCATGAASDFHCFRGL